MLRFIDLFAGIGGIRLAFERSGGQCVFSSEWDRFAQQTYAANHGHQPHGDIRQIAASDIPDHDILLGGFPCTAFSISGVSKRNSLGYLHGLIDTERGGNLFFEIARILEAKRPRAFFLENVKNLRHHDRGKTFRIISDILDELNYAVFTNVVDAKYYVPQHRERIFIAGFRRDLFPNMQFKFPEFPAERPVRLRDVIERDVNTKYTLSDKLWDYLQAYKQKHRQQGNGFGFGLIDADSDDYTRTLSARYYKDGAEILIAQPGKNPRRLTPRECARLMGYPETFKIPVSDTQAYKQFGNSVVVPAVEAVAREMMRILQKSAR